MRLSVFTPEISPQLLIDLRKIYQNYFTDEQLETESLEALVDNEKSLFYATMFNERHLGSVQVTIDNNQALLRLLTIRDLTRRRGIAKNLLKEVEKQLKIKNVCSVKMDIKNIKEEEREGLILFMQACRYQFNDNVFSKTL